MSALVLDVMVLGSMIARIGDLGFTPNRTAALGLNLVLLVNLAGAGLYPPDSSRVGAGSIGSSAGRRPTCPSLPYGPLWSWSSFPRCLALTDRSGVITG